MNPADPNQQSPQGYPQQNGYAPPLGQPPMPPGMPGQNMPQRPAPPQQQAPTGQPQRPKTNPNSTQNTLQIAEIRDGIVIMNDGSFRAVVMAKAINFDLMSQAEQEAVEYSYQGFLNSLYFPTQIFIHSQKIDLQPYIAKLDRLRAEHDNMLLAMLIEDYVTYMQALSEQANIMDKEFYVVIPYYSHADVQRALTSSKNFFSGVAGIFNSKEQHVVVNEVELENAKTELRNRVQAVLSALLQCGVQGLPLDTQELIELYYNMYNPDTAVNQQLKSFETVDADVITKGDGHAAQPHLQGGLPYQ